MMIRRGLWKWFGFLSTLILAAVALAPQAFMIPQNMRAWVFLSAILWFFLFTTGSFNS